MNNNFFGLNIKLCNTFLCTILVLNSVNNNLIYYAFNNYVHLYFI